MNELVDNNTPLKRQKEILRKFQTVLLLKKIKISNDYIETFSADGRGKISIFRDLCTQNDIEPTRELCVQLLGSDDAQFRKEWCKKDDTKSQNNDRVVMNSDQKANGL